MAADAFTYNGTDLGTLSVGVRAQQGLHRLPSLEASPIAIRNQDRPEPFWIARRGGTVTLAGSITGTSRANFQANILAFKQLVNPTKDSNNQPTYVALTWDQRANQRLMVYTVALDVQELGPTAGEWTWELERRDYWEDASALAGSGLSTAAVISNDGDQDVSPVWTIPFSGASTGFDFTVGTTRIDLDTTTFVNTDSLVIDSAARTIKKNGTSVMSNVNTTNTTAAWPKLTAQDNVLAYSEAFDNAYWTKTRSSISANAVANPVDGLTTADELIEDGTASQTHYAVRSLTFEAKSHIFSVYAKENTRSWIVLLLAGIGYKYFDLSTGVVGSGTATSSAIEDAGSGWYRCSITGIPTAGAQNALIYLASGDGANTYSGDGTSGLYIFGAMLHPGTILRPYVATAAHPNLVTVTTGSNYTIGYSVRRLYE